MKRENEARAQVSELSLTQCPFYFVPEHGSYIACTHRDTPWQPPCSVTRKSRHPVFEHRDCFRDTLSSQSECFIQHGVSHQNSNQTTVYQLPCSRTHNELKEIRKVVDVCHRPTENVTSAANNERYKVLNDREQSVSTVPTGVHTATV